jgi:hypothetical protein
MSSLNRIGIFRAGQKNEIRHKLSKPAQGKPKWVVSIGLAGPTSLMNGLKWTEANRFAAEFLARRYQVPTDQLIYLVKKKNQLALSHVYCKKNTLMCHFHHFSSHLYLSHVCHLVATSTC